MDFKKVLFKTNTIDVEKALPDAIIYCNKDGKIQWVNDKAAEIFETSKMHLLTSNVTDFIENAHNIILNAVASNKSVITKFQGREIYFDMTSKEIESGYVLSFRDVDEELYAQKLKPSVNTPQNMEANLFMLKMANEFKSPLQSIVGFSQAMSDGLGGNMSEQQEKYIRIIKKNSSDLMYFITKLFDLTKTETELKSPELKTFDINSAITSVVKFNEQLYKEKDVRWNVTMDEGVKNTIVSDEDMLKSVVQNVLEVIIKNIEMGEISINLSVPDAEFIKSKNIFGENFLMISISSSSLLLSESDLEYMFDPYKIIDTVNRKNLLRAIILASVKNMIQALNGLIWVESVILKNTSFNILIPQGKI